MAQIGEVIFSKLSAHAGLSALVGTRISPQPLAQRPTLPAVTFQKISNAFGSDRGDSGKATIERPRYQFDCYGATYSSAHSVAQQLREALAAIAQASNPRVDVAYLQDELDYYEPETGRYRVIVDAFIWHEES